MKDKIKVLYLVSTLKRCGPTNQLFNIISNLDSSKFSVKIITLSGESKDTLKPKFIEAGIIVESLSQSRIMGLIKGFPKLKMKIRDFKPNIVHSQGVRSDEYAVKLMAYSIKAIGTIRCIPNEDYLMTYGKWKGKIMANNHLKNLKKLDQVISVSNSISSSLIKIGVKTETIHNGCDIIRYKPASKEEKINIKNKLSLPENKTILISVGHLSTRKDPLTIINAFKNSKNKKDLYLIFVGDGELYKQCEEAIKHEENIKLIGRVSNVEDYLKASDVFISASLSEGLPNTVLESLSCGVPTILSNIPQHLEFFDKDLYKDFFFEILDVRSLTKIIENLPHSNLLELPTRSIIEDKFDSKTMSLKYQEKYFELLKEI